MGVRAANQANILGQYLNGQRCLDGSKGSSDEGKRLNLDLHIILIVRPRYQAIQKKGLELSQQQLTAAWDAPKDCVKVCFTPRKQTFRVQCPAWLKDQMSRGDSQSSN